MLRSTLHGIDSLNRVIMDLDQALPIEGLLDYAALRFPNATETL